MGNLSEKLGNVVWWTCWNQLPSLRPWWPWWILGTLTPLSDLYYILTQKINRMKWMDLKHLLHQPQQRKKMFLVFSLHRNAPLINFLFICGLFFLQIHTCFRFPLNSPHTGIIQTTNLLPKFQSLLLRPNLRRYWCFYFSIIYVYNFYVSLRLCSLKQPTRK